MISPSRGGVDRPECAPIDGDEDNAGAASQRPYLKGRIMSGERRSRREDGASCPRCGAAMKDVVTIVPIAGEPGLIAYECSNCGYVMSVLVHPRQAKD